MCHHGPIAAVAAKNCYGNSYIATAGYDNQIILWDALTRKSLARCVHDHLVNHCAFNSDGTLLASASSDYSARIWEIPSLRLKAALIGHTDDVDMAVFSPNDELIATCALDRTIRVFNLAGQCLKVFRGHTGNIISVAWMRDGKWLISSSVDGTVREWDIASESEIHCYNITVRTDTLVINEDGVIFAGDDKGRIITINDGKISYVQAHQAGIKKIEYDAAHQVLITLSYDRTIALWQISATLEIHELSRTEIPALVWARSAAHIGTTKIAVGTFGSSYGVFDWSNNEWNFDGVIPDPSLNAVAVIGDTQYAIGDAGILLTNGKPTTHLDSLCNFLVVAGDFLLTGGQLGQLFDAKTGKIIYQHHSPLNCGTSFLRDGKLHIIIGSYTGEAIVFTENNSGELTLVTTIKIYENAIKGLVTNDTQIFSVCANTSVAWHNISDFTLVRLIPNAHERIANGCCRAGNDGFASIGRDKMLHIWIDGNDEIYQTPHPNSVKCICVSADGNTLMTGAYTGTIASFDMATCSWNSFSRPTASGISSLTFDAKHNLFLASSYDGQIYLINSSEKRTAI